MYTFFLSKTAKNTDNSFVRVEALPNAMLMPFFTGGSFRPLVFMTYLVLIWFLEIFLTCFDKDSRTVPAENWTKHLIEFDAPCTQTVAVCGCDPLCTKRKIKTWTLISCDTLCKPPNKAARSVSKSQKWLSVRACVCVFVKHPVSVYSCHYRARGARVKMSFRPEWRRRSRVCLHSVWQPSNPSVETRLQRRDLTSLPSHTDRRDVKGTFLRLSWEKRLVVDKLAESRAWLRVDIKIWLWIRILQ